MSKKKKILLLTDWYEPGYKAGGPIQSVKNFVAGMHELFEIAVLTSSHDLGGENPYPGIPENQWIDRAPGIKIYYASPGSLKGSVLQRIIKDVDPDFIYLNSMYSYHYSILPVLLFRRNKIRAQIVLSPRGMLRASAIQYKSAKKKLFIAVMNLFRTPGFIRFHATDEQEKKDIQTYFPRAQKVELIANFSAPLPERLISIEKSIDRLRCVYISRILPIKNIIFFLEVLKKVPPEISIQFSVYGDVEDEKYWNEAKRVISEMPEHIKIEYGGSLEHNRVNEVLEAHHLFVLPTFGENFGHAIFEAWSAGRPALISDRTPWHFLKKQLTGWDIPLDNPAAWLNALEEAAGWDQSAFDSWSRKSREFAERHVIQFNLKQEYFKLFS